MITEPTLLQHIIDMVIASGTAGLGNNYNRVLNTIVSGKWNNDLRVKAANAHNGMIHSWMATVLTGGQKRQAGRMNHFWGVRLRGVLQTWDKGDLDNSELYFAAEIAAIKRYFGERKDLGLDEVATGFRWHDEIQETNRATQHAGTTGCIVTNLFLGCHLKEDLPN